MDNKKAILRERRRLNIADNRALVAYLEKKTGESFNAGQISRGDPTILEALRGQKLGKWKPSKKQRKFLKKTVYRKKRRGKKRRYWVGMITICETPSEKKLKHSTTFETTAKETYSNIRGALVRVHNNIWTDHRIRDVVEVSVLT